MHDILIVDDDQMLVKMLKILLIDEGYNVATAISASQALAAVQDHEYGLILLDIVMPDLDGIELCRRIRKTSITPIIFISSNNTLDDKVTALLSGGDDYIQKPFHPQEMLARIVAALRRSGYVGNGDSTLRTVDFMFDPIDNEVTIVRTGMHVSLTPIEARLLRYLLNNPGRVLTRDMLVVHVWGHENDTGSKLLDVNMKRLRDKVEPDPSNPQYLLTVRRLGYKYQPSRQRTSPSASETGSLLELQRGF